MTSVTMKSSLRNVAVNEVESGESTPRHGKHQLGNEEDGHRNRGLGNDESWQKDGENGHDGGNGHSAVKSGNGNRKNGRLNGGYKGDIDEKDMPQRSPQKVSFSPSFTGIGATALFLTRHRRSVASIPYKETSALELTNQFCSTSTAHGLGQLAEEPKVPVKFMWAAIFFFALAMCGWHLFVRISVFADFTTKENVKISQEVPVFPDVTVCNIETISASNAERILQNPSSGLRKFQEFIYGSGPKDLSEQYQFSFEDNINFYNSLYENLDREETEDLGHSFQDFLVECRFARESCLDLTYFELVQNDDYFNCYTISTKRLAEDPFGVGPVEGLSMIFFLETNLNGPMFLHDYDTRSPLRNSLGVRVTIHPQGTFALPLLTGDDIMPGHSTTFLLSIEKHEYLDQPYGHCVKSTSQQWFGNNTYSSLACLQLCAQQFIYNNCSCISADLLVPEALDGQPYCGNLHRDLSLFYADAQCLAEARRVFYDGEDANCQCHPPCKEFKYVSTISSSAWPAPKYQDDFFVKYIMSRPDREELKAYKMLSNFTSYNLSFASTSLISDNFARLNVYFATPEVSTHITEPAYPLSALTSDMGGALGFWLGMSTITVIEVIYFLARLCLLTGRKIMKRCKH